MRKNSWGDRMKKWLEKLAEGYRGAHESILFSDGRRNMTEEEFCTAVVQAHNRLVEAGVEHGMKILILIPISIELYILLYALWSIGATAVLFDSDMTFENMVECMKRVKPGIVFADSISGELAGKLQKKSKCSIIHKIQEVLSYKEGRASFCGKIEFYPSEHALITFTGGNVGLPKAVARKYQYLGVEEDFIQKHFTYEKGEIDFAVILLFTILNPMYGLRTVIPSKELNRISRIELAEQIQIEHVDRMVVTPFLLKRLTGYCLMYHTCFPTLKKVFVGGGPLYWQYLERINKVFPNAQVKLLYGCCEAEPITMYDLSWVTEEQKKAMCMGQGLLGGKITEGMCVKIIRNEPYVNFPNMTKSQFQKMCVEDCPGEIVVSGKYVVNSYLDGEGDTQNKIQADDIVWHRTGDLGQIKEDGLLYLYGRSRECVCYGQEEFYPFSEESRIYANFDVRQAAYFQWWEKRVLAVCCEREVYDAINNRKEEFHLDLVIRLDKIPLDRKHQSKIDYQSLHTMLSGNR